MTETNSSEATSVPGKDGMTQTGNGTLVSVVVGQESVERIAASIRQNGIMLGAAVIALLFVGFLFNRYAVQAEVQTYQFNLLRSCLQSSQCDVQKVIETLNKEK